MAHDGGTQGFFGFPISDLTHFCTAGRPGGPVAFGLDGEIARRFGTANPGTAGLMRRLTATMRREGGPDRGGVDVGMLAGDDPAQSLQDVTLIAAHIAKAGRRPLLVACDHTASLGAAMGAATTGPPPLYLHIDAHFDLGWHMPRPDLDNGNFVDALLRSGTIAEVVNLGGRSPMTQDGAYQGHRGFRWIAAPTGPEAIAALELLLEAWPHCPIYVSLDPDVLSPGQGPGVCCPVPGGLDRATLFALCRRLGADGRVIGADLSELAPDAATNERSAQALTDIAHCLLALFPAR